MRTKRYRVTLTPAEREHVAGLLRGGTHAARTLQHARVLLLADAPAEQSCRFDAEIAATAGVSVDTVERVRQRFVEEGLEAALVPKRPT